MDTPAEPSPEPADPLALGQAAASQLGGEWQLDTFEDAPPEQQEQPQEQSREPEATPSEPELLSTRGADAPRSPNESDSITLPPSPEQIIEAMLFVGGHPLTADVACSAVRGLTPERFQATVDALNRRYREQWRPYTIEARDDGFVLVVRATYRSLRERLFGGIRETRLSQPALDVLSVVTYRQPVGKAEVDAIRGTDSGAVLRQLVRLGMVAVQHRGESGSREVRYGTTPRFLQVFGLSSLDELPRLGDAQQV
jgi:segregation and condensation protein B